MIKIKGCPFTIPKTGYRVLWEVTYRCNMNCKHCFIFENPQVNLTGKELSTEDAIQLINKFNDVKEIWFTGGEPLLRKDLPQLIKYASNKGINTSISTNGIMLHTELLNQLIQNGIKYFHLSLDSVNKDNFENIRGKNTFDKVINAFKLLKEANIPYGASCVITTNNFEEIDEIINFCKKWSCSRISMYPPFTYGRSKSGIQYVDSNKLNSLFDSIIQKYQDDQEIEVELIRFENFLNSNPFCIGHRFLTVNPSGKLGPCPWYCKKNSQLCCEIDDFNQTVIKIESLFKKNDMLNCPAK